MTIRKALDEKFLVGTVLMDLSKGFDCIPHDLLIAKLHAYGFSQKTVTFIYSYLKRRKQKVKVNNFLSDFLTLLLGVPKGSISGPVLFNIFLNDLLSTLKLSDLFNFVDDNSISTTADNIDHLLLTLKHESELAVKWFKDNQMIVNPDKFQAMILQNPRNSKNYEPVKLEIGSTKIETKNVVKLLGIIIDNKLNFEERMSELYKKASMQLNSISCLHRFMGKEQKEALINSFIFSNFNYCPLVWHFCSCKSSQKIEKIQLRCLRTSYDVYFSHYQTLLKLSQKPSMEIKRLRNLGLEIFKTINDLNPSFIKSIFSVKLNARVRPNDILVKARKSATFGDKSLATLGPKIWNTLPQNIKAENSYVKFKECIATWFGPKCKCNICSFNNS